MTKLKKDFEETFGSLDEQQRNVKRRVLAHVQQRKQPRNKRPYLAVAALTAVMITGGALWINGQQEQSAALIEEQHAPLQADVYEMKVYGAHYLSPNAATEAQAKKNTFDEYVAQQAMIYYAQQQQLEVTKAELAAIIDARMKRFDEYPNTAQTQYFHALRQHFHLSEETYREKIVHDELLAKRYEELFLEQLGLDAKNDAAHEEMQRIHARAEAAYVQQYAPQLEQFKRAHQISDNPTPQFSATTQLHTVFGTYMIARVDGKDVFAAPNELTVGWTTGEAVGADAFINELHAYASSDEPFVFFTRQTIPQYKDVAKRYKEERPHKKEEVVQFMQLLDIFENTANMR